MPLIIATPHQVKLMMEEKGFLRDTVGTDYSSKDPYNLFSLPYELLIDFTMEQA
jgi:hypothetical protein